MPTPGVNWRIAPGEVVIVELDSGAAVVTEAAHALYRRGSLGWSLRSAGGKGLGRLMHPMLRRAAGVPTRLHRYEGPGEVAFGSGLPGPVRGVELPAAAGVVVERGAMLGMTAGVSADCRYTPPLRDTIKMPALDPLHVRNTSGPYFAQFRPGFSHHQATFHPVGLAVFASAGPRWKKRWT